jgi:hypothetical protein
LRCFGWSAARGIQRVYSGQRKGPFCKQNSPFQKLSLKSANITSQLLSRRLQQVQQQQRLQQEQQQRQQQEQLQLQQLQRLLQLRQQLQQELLWLLLWLLLQHLSKQPNRAKRQEREIQQFSSYGKPPSKTYENLTGTPQRMQ